MSARRITAALAAIIMLMLCCTPAFADTNAVRSARNGVVRVFCFDEPYVSLGTGFAVGIAGDRAQYFVTNYHVVELNPKDVVISIVDVNNYIPATVIYSDVNIDIAILRIDTPIQERTPLTMMSASEMDVMDNVHALGFPAAADTSNSFDSTLDDITVTSGTITKLNFKEGARECIQHDAVINGGNSGGPLVSDDGFAIGINTFKNADENVDGMYYTVYVDYVMRALDELNIPYSTGTPVQPTPEPTAAPTERPTAEPDEDEEDEEEPASNDKVSPIVWVLPIALIAAGGIVAGVIIAVRKGGGEKAGNMTPITIICKGGSLAGASWRLNESLVIGRDPSRCQIVFPSAEPGISWVHCRIELTGTGCTVTDLGSSFGTYTADGRLAPNEPVKLKFGDRFFLASQQNVFFVG